MSQTILVREKWEELFSKLDAKNGSKWRRIEFFLFYKVELKKGETNTFNLLLHLQHGNQLHIMKALKNLPFGPFELWRSFFPHCIFLSIPLFSYFMYWSKPCKLKAFKEYSNSKKYSHEYMWIDGSSKNGGRRQGRLQASEFRNLPSDLFVETTLVLEIARIIVSSLKERFQL